MSSIWLYPPNKGGGGGGGDVKVVDNLTTQSSVDALSALQGYLLDQKIKSLSEKIASDTELGSVKIDNDTIKIRPDGTIYVDGVLGKPIFEIYEVTIPTTIDGQTEWTLPPDKYVDGDTIIVKYNSTVLHEDMYTIVNGVITIPDGTGVPIAHNNVEVVIFHNEIQDPSFTIYQSILPTTIVGQSEWTINVPYDSINDTILVVHNSTLVHKNDYNITGNTLTLYDTDGIPIANNEVSVIVFSNAKPASNYELPIATKTLLGGIRPDGKTIIVDPITGIASVSGIEGGGLKYERGTVTQSIPSQKEFTLPFPVDLVNDLLILSLNGMFLEESLYTTRQDGPNTIVVIDDELIIDTPLRNSLSGIVIKGSTSGSIVENVILKAFDECLITTSVGQKQWIIPLSTFDPVNDVLFVNYNTTLLSKQEYNLVLINGEYVIEIDDIPPTTPIANNTVCLTILQNVISNGTNSISGNIIIDDSIEEKKLAPTLRDKVNLRVITFEETGDVISGDKDAHRIMPFTSRVIEFNSSVLQSSTQDLTFNIKISDDLQSWANLIPNDVTILANSNISKYVLPIPIELPKDKIVRLSIVNSNGEAKSLSINMTVKTI